MSMEMALKLGGASLCETLLGDLKLKDDEARQIVKSGCGFYATLDFMVRLSSNMDWILSELLVVLPTIDAYHSFLDRLPKVDVSAEEFEFLSNLGHLA